MNVNLILVVFVKHVGKSCFNTEKPEIVDMRAE